MNYSRQVVDYYNQTQLDYKLVLSLRKHHGMHFGYTDDQHKAIPDTIINVHV